MDPIADMLTRIRNALLRGGKSVDIPHSKIKESILEILKRDGYVQDFKVAKTGATGTIRVMLKYHRGGQSVIGGLKRISTLGSRRYEPVDKIPLVRSGLGTVIVSTSKGIMTDRDARKERVGGEMICAVW